MGRILVLVLGIFSAAAADACVCSTVQLGNKEVQAARYVFVFRLMDAHVDAEQDTPIVSSESVIGTIRVAAHVRGRTKAKEIRYSTDYCCGSRLEVGKNYIGFLGSDGGRFYASASNVIPLWGYFGRDEADSLEAVLRGKKKLEDAFAYGIGEINQVRPPPPPCPTRRKKAR